MRAFAIFAAFLLPLAAQPSSSGQRAIELAQQVLVSTLDADLPRQPLLPWLTQALGPTVKLVWEVTDCGEQTGNPDLDRGRDFPMCVDAVASWTNGRMAIVSVVVGTFEKGPVGPPSLWSVSVRSGSGARFEAVARLRDLPKMVGAN